MSIFYPISALHAVTGKFLFYFILCSYLKPQSSTLFSWNRSLGERLHVVQAPPMILQPCLFARCLTETSSFLDAHCQQDYVPEMMFVAQHNSDTMQIIIHRQPVLVENGCTCRFNSNPITLLGSFPFIILFRILYVCVYIYTVKKNLLVFPDFLFCLFSTMTDGPEMDNSLAALLNQWSD